MKIVRNNIIPFPGFAAVNLFGILFARKRARISETTILHESIHTAQMRELGYVPFYILYFLEWLVRLPFYQDSHEAYRNISFEVEAYDMQRYENYLNKRKHFASFKYLFLK